MLPGGRQLTVDGASPRSVELTGLTNGRTYPVLITAHNPVAGVTESGTIRPASEDQWIHVTGPDYWEFSFGPVQLGWSVSPEVESGTAFQAIELDGHVLRYVSAADRSADFRLSPGAHRLAVVAFDDEGEEFFYGDTLIVGLYGQEQPRFGDVPVVSAFHREISWLADAGITTGRADGTFGPTESISREAMAAFLYRLSGPRWSATNLRRPRSSPTSRPVTRSTRRSRGSPSRGSRRGTRTAPRARSPGQP